MFNGAEKNDHPRHPDTDRRVSRDWVQFAHNLTQVLPRLEEDQFLVVSAKHGNRYLQFAGQGAWGLRVEAASNRFLKGDDRLTRQQMAWLRARGWNAPTGTPKQSTPERDPDGSPNYFIDFPAAAPLAELVTLVIDTMVCGYAFPYPGELTYESFDSSGRKLEFKELGLKHVSHQDNSPLPLMDSLLSVFRLVTGIDDLVFDDDGELTVRYGAIWISTVLLNDKVRLYSALLDDVSESPSLLKKLNHINDGAHRLRCFIRDETVWATLDVPAAPFIQDHLAAAMHEFSELAEGLAIALRAQFSNKTVIEPPDPIVCLH
jgi:hypothetical protein